MEDPNSTLLPYILETLSRKPELCDTFDNLCRDIQETLAKEENNKYGNVRGCIQRALGVGQSLGIITLTNETIRMPFNFRHSKASKAPNNAKSNEGTANAAEASTTQRTDMSQDRNPHSQQQQPQRNQKMPYNSNSVREEESDYSIVLPKKVQRGMVRTRGRSRSAKRKPARGNSRGKSSYRGRRGRGIYRKRNTTRYRR